MKKANFLAVFFVLLLILTACGNKQAENKGDNSNRRPDFGQPDRPADITGIVKSITGNEVTILKIERPERNNGADNNAGAGNVSANSGSAGGRAGALPGFGGARTGGNFQRGEGGGSNGQISDRAAMIKQLEAMSAGSEIITIPVGIRMLKPDTANLSDTAGAEIQRQNMNMAEAALSDIQAEKMVSIWLDENGGDRKIASFVLISR